jgi:hypothetical protein
MARGRRRVAPFRSWGTPLVTLLAFMVLTKNWLPVALLAAAMAYYLLAVRVTPCRVATRHRRPCRWRVVGPLRCCDWHSGHKNGPPTLVRVRGHLFPMIAWPRREERPDWRRTDPEPQPRESAGPLGVLAPNARAWSGWDKAMLLLMLVSVVSVIGVIVQALLGS